MRLDDAYLFVGLQSLQTMLHYTARSSSSRNTNTAQTVMLSTTHALLQYQKVMGEQAPARGIKRSNAGLGLDSLKQAAANPAAMEQAMAMMTDPAARLQVESMMRDPKVCVCVLAIVSAVTNSCWCCCNYMFSRNVQWVLDAPRCSAYNQAAVVANVCNPIAYIIVMLYF
jgi:hypothetical protein